MAKTLLGIIGSPRKHGNCELFIKEIYNCLPQGWQLKMIRLPEMEIRPCRACYQCLFGEMQCTQDDDFNDIVRELAQADAYAVAAPTYLLGANASLKQFLDRGLSFYGHLDQLWGKPGVAAAVAGINGMEGHTKLNVESFIKLTMGDLRGAEVVYGALPGEIFLNEEGRKAARKLADALVNGKEISDTVAPICPTCGGDTFRFLSDGQVRCMLCSSSGQYGWESGKLRFHTVPGEHPLFLTYEDVKRHAQWLRGMKDLFMARRKELKAVTQEYTQIGSWVRPKKQSE